MPPPTPSGLRTGGLSLPVLPSEEARVACSVGSRGLGGGRGGGHSLGTAHEEVDLQEVVQDGDSAGPDEA